MKSLQLLLAGALLVAGAVVRQALFPAFCDEPRAFEEGDIADLVERDDIRLKPFRHGAGLLRRAAVRLPDLFEQRFGGWDKVMKVPFANGGVLDQLIAANNK